MQMSPGDLNKSDRQTYRRWSVAFAVVYGIIALIFTGLIVNHSPITAEVVAKVEGMKSAEATASAPVLPSSTSGTRRH